MNTLSKRRFEVLAARLNYGAAVEIMQDDLPPNFWDSCNLGEWLQIYNATPNSSPLNERALKAIHGAADDMEQLVKVFKQAPAGSELHRMTANRLRTIDLGFDDVHQALVSADDDETERHDIISRLIRLASTPDQKLLVFSLLPEDSPERDELITSLDMANYTYEDWRRLQRNSRHDSIISYATKKMVATATELDELIEAYSCLDKDDDREMILLQKIQSLDLPFADWKNADEEASDDKLKTLLYEKMIASAVEPSDLVSLYKNSDDDQKLQKQIMAKLEVTENSFDDWQELYQEADSGSELEGLILKKMIEGAQDFDDLNGIIDTVEDFDEIDKAIVALLGEKIKTTEADYDQWKTMHSNLRGDNNNLDEIIHERMAATASDLDELLELFSDSPQRSKTRQLIGDRIDQLDVSYEDAKNAFDDYESDSTEGKLLLGKMAAKASDLEELMFVYDNTSDNNTKKALQQKIIESKATFEELKEARNELDDSSSPVDKILLEKMISQADDFDELVALYADLPKGSKFIKPILEKIKGIEQDFDELFESYENLEDNDQESELGETLLRKMIGLTDEPENLRKIYDNSEEHDQIRKEVLKKIGSIETDFRTWHDIVDEISDADDDLTGVALEKMMSTASDHDDFATIFVHSPDDSPLRPKIQKKLQQLQLTKKQWNAVRDTAESDDCNDLTEFVDAQLEKIG
jgi:hypothetical protein